jgi:hypothetical protein
MLRKSGRKCGAVYIDIAFKRWLRDFLGPTHYQKLDPNIQNGKLSSHTLEGQSMRTLMKAFDVLKRNFSSNARDGMLDLPEPLHNLDIPGKVDEGQIIITK